MADLVRQGVRDPRTRTVAINLIQSISASGIRDYLRGVEQYVRDNLRLLDEPEELITRPEYMLADIEERGQAWGDCDDAAVLVATLLAAIGIPCRFKAVFPGPDGGFGHVFAEYQLRNSPAWIAIDPTISHAPVYSGDFITEEV